MRAEFEDKEWDVVHQPCPLCNSSDAVGINKDRSAKCFSCGKFMKNYDKATEGKDMEVITPKPIMQQANNVEGTFSPLSDRKIKLDTAKKYGVKVVHDLQGRVVKHFYPYYNGNELTANKCRNVVDKSFYLQGTYNETGLFGQQLFKSGKYITITAGS